MTLVWSRRQIRDRERERERGREFAHTEEPSEVGTSRGN